MKFCSRLVWVGIVGISLLSSRGTEAANRIEVEDTELVVGSTGNDVAVTMDSDQAILGFSVYFTFDENEISISDVELGAPVAALSPEWADGDIDNSNGVFSYAVVFDLSGPSLTKELASGTGIDILNLIVDVDAGASGTSLINLLNVTNTEPRRLNVMTDTSGNSVSPSLIDGTMSLVVLTPVIEGYSGNSGEEGTVFFINGRNFDRGGLTVQVCGVDADFTLLGQDIQVTAPECGSGFAVVEVCNDFGCDTDPEGFEYPTPPGGPIIEGFQLNSGGAGQRFFVVGQNFGTGGLSVEVCGVPATFTLLGQDIQVTAPECAAVAPGGGWARVAVTTDFGTDFENQGFNYDPTITGTLFKRGDTNDDGGVDLSDGVATLGYLFLGRAEPPCLDAADANDSGGVDLGDAVFTFNFLFLGGGDIPPPNSCGLDTTDDSTTCLTAHSDC